MNAFISKNITAVSVVIFVLLFSLIYVNKPSCFFMRDGTLREFGIGYKNKTIFPLWLASIILGLCVYLGVSFYSRH